MIKIFFFIILLSSTLIVFGQKDYTQFVNPFIGTSNYGATHPGPVMPQGMVSVVPFNVAFKKGVENEYEKDSEWHSRPYVNENTFLTGFSHVNLSGVGCPDLGSILTMPTSGDLELDPEKYGTTYKDEIAQPGYYSNVLTKGNIKTQMTATMRAGLSQYKFEVGKQNLILNLGLGLTNETGAYMKFTSPTEVEGYKLFGTFCYNPEDVRPVYFVMKIDTESQNYGAWKKMPKYDGVEGEWTRYNNKYKPYKAYPYEMVGENIGAYFSYDFKVPTTVSVKIGISYVSIANARQNLETEIPDYNFGTYTAAAKRSWNNLLSKIEVKGDSEDDKIIFYTALYHTLLHPNIVDDVNGQYPKMGHKGIGQLTFGHRYTVFSLWDTYRNLHPFMCLVYPELQLEYVRSMIGMAEENEYLPKWELMGMETSVMVGDPATPVIADTYMRGLKDFDVAKAYVYMKRAAINKTKNPIRPGLTEYDQLGYIPEQGIDSVWGTVSTTLEYNISDWNLAQLANELGYANDYIFFLKRSKSYLNYFDDETGMLRPRQNDGSWLTPFNPEAGKNFEPVIGFVEGNAWQYRFYVPHDIRGLIDRLGGDKKFESALTECFTSDNYDMANEPDITYPYLYNYVPGSNQKAIAKVEELVRKHYFNGPAGIPGNDDTGTLSTWLLYSMMGFYPDCPGSETYTVTRPLFDKITLHLDPKYYSGKKIEIINSKDVYDKSIFNNNVLETPFINHSDLVKGGIWEF